MIHVISAGIICPFCPTTVSGKTADGKIIYARYRWGHISVRLDPRPYAPLDGAKGVSIFEKNYGDQYGGILTGDELRDITTGLVEWPTSLDF